MIKVEFSSLGKPEEKLYLKKTRINESLKSTEVLIAVLFFPINPADLLLVEGMYSTSPPSLPSPIGAECVAKVIKVGKKVRKFKIDDIVIPLTRNNWIERIKIEEVNLIKIDKNIDLLQASMLKVNPASAYLMLNNYVKLKQNDTIMQNAANSGVGNYIIQLSKLYKINTVNIIRRKEAALNIKKIGAKEIVVYNKKKCLKIKHKVKLIIDAVGGENLDDLASYLEDHGTIINYGLLSGKKNKINPRKLIFNNICIKGFWLSLWLQKMSYTEKKNLYKHLSELVKNKYLYTKIEDIYHIKDIKTAVKTANSYKRSGKILVSFDRKIIKDHLKTII